MQMLNFFYTNVKKIKKNEKKVLISNEYDNLKYGKLEKKS